jgi:hypothetical protein
MTNDMYSAQQARADRDTKIKNDNRIIQDKAMEAQNLLEAKTAAYNLKEIEHAPKVIAHALDSIKAASAKGLSEALFYSGGPNKVAFAKLRELGYRVKQVIEEVVVSEPHSDFDGINNYMQDTNQAKVEWD